jgi:hypothetical protein
MEMDAGVGVMYIRWIWYNGGTERRELIEYDTKGRF